ncbi:MAG: serine/threonine-protein kinase, partial [bacterium]
GRGVVHRDIKPDNIMIERATGRAMVMDFGIARAITGAAPTATQGLTRVGEVVGTPEYMSPEQATGDSVDGRSDLYALGLTAYFALSGRLAISGDTTGKILARQITEQLPPMQSIRADVPQALGDAIDRCVMKDPAERFQTGEELVETLDAAKLSGPEIPLAIRLLQQEQSSLAMLLLFGFVIAYMILALGVATDRGNYDMMLPIVILISVLLTRATQVMREVGRVAASGFSRDEIQNGLYAVLGERDQRRAELRADERTQIARKKTLRSAVTQLLLGALMFIAALQFRHKRPTGGYTIDITGTILVFSAMILLGVGLALLLRSPFRRPVGERAYRAFWLGPIGRAFVRVSGRSEWKQPGLRPVVTRSGVASIPARIAMPTGTPPVVAPDRIDALEQRVADLEQWRREVGLTGRLSPHLELHD